MRAFRIAKAQHARNPPEMLSGRGALLYGGRWSSPGRAVVYASSSASLATLEISVHLNSPAVIPAFRIIDLEIPRDLILVVDPTDLPAGWDEPVINPIRSQSWGDVWFDDQISAVLEVPSAVVPAESNYLINPDHSDFGRIAIGQIRRHPFDARIKA